MTTTYPDNLLSSLALHDIGLGRGREWEKRGNTLKYQIRIYFFCSFVVGKIPSCYTFNIHLILIIWLLDIFYMGLGLAVICFSV